MDEALDELGIELPRSRKLECPRHVDKTPSLHVYEDGFYCHSCGQSGDGIGLIAWFTNMDVRQLLAERSGDRPHRRAATKGMKRGDVARTTLRMYRTMHNDWFKWLHDQHADAPQWLFERQLDIWCQAFDDLRDKMLGHGLYTEDGAMAPYLQEQEIATFARHLDSARAFVVEEVRQKKHAEVRNAYWRRRRALQDPSIYNTA